MTEEEFEDKWDKKWRELDYKILTSFSSKPEILHKMKDEGLNKLLELGISFEEYEICAKVNNEINKRKNEKIV